MGLVQPPLQNVQSSRDRVNNFVRHGDGRGRGTRARQRAREPRGRGRGRLSVLISGDAGWQRFDKEENYAQ